MPNSKTTSHVFRGNDEIFIRKKFIFMKKRINSMNLLERNHNYN